MRPLGVPNCRYGHSRPSHFVPVLNNVRYASDSDHSRYESELTLWAISRQSAPQQSGSYSITSLARSRIEVGNVKPVALAVFKLSVNSKLLACSTGRSDAFAPR